MYIRYQLVFAGQYGVNAGSSIGLEFGCRSTHLQLDGSYNKDYRGAGKYHVGDLTVSDSCYFDRLYKLIGSQISVGKVSI